MPKGGKKRTNAEYEQEIEDSVKRFKKYPERKRASNSDSQWFNFLNHIGINTETNRQETFWGRVRERVYSDTHPVEQGGVKYLPPVSELIHEYDNRTVYFETDVKGSYYKEIYFNRKGETYRGIKTGRFTKRNG